MNSNLIQQAILVAIGYQRPSKGSASRIRDDTPSHYESWKLPTGEAKRHLAFISQVVMPFIEKNYRVDTRQNKKKHLCGQFVRRITRCIYFIITAKVIGILRLG